MNPDHVCGGQSTWRAQSSGRTGLQLLIVWAAGTVRVLALLSCGRGVYPLACHSPVALPPPRPQSKVA